jgi:hypothetical protein
MEMARLIHEESRPTFHHSKTTTLLQSTPILPIVQGQLQSLIQKIEAYVRNGSGWVVEKVVALDLCFARLIAYVII